MNLCFLKFNVLLVKIPICIIMSKTSKHEPIIKNLASQFSFNSRRRTRLTHSDQVESENSKSPEKEISSNNETTVENKDYPHEKKSVQKRKVTVKKIEYEGEDADHIGSKQQKWVPDNWEQILSNIREMRKSNDAPVDTMGCDVSHELNLTPKVRRYQVLVSLMLSSQTKDEINFAAMTRLREHGLTVDSILGTNEEVIGKLIHPVGFWKTKAKNIKKVTQILRDEYDDDIPNSVETLCKLPGVGPKMAHLAMNVGWGIVTGIGVDTHVHRISNRLKWVKKETKNPEATRKELESWLPQDLWKEVNHLLVGFGQTLCRAIDPECRSCLNKEICPYAASGEKNKKKPKNYKKNSKTK